MMEVTKIAEFLRCPLCRNTLEIKGQAVCTGGHSFPVTDGVIDFLNEPPVDADVALDYHTESIGMTKRTERFILPWLSNNSKDITQLRVLEDGCGFGHTVQALTAAGVDAYGIDPGRRTATWASIGLNDRFFVADGTRLPFADGTFDAVTSSGVLEHVGEGKVCTRSAQHSFESLYIQEIIRVLSSGGRALVAHPNGAFPVDFWHGYCKIPRSHARLHMPYEAWMPNAIRISRWAQASPYSTRVRFLPPGDYLAFDNIQSRWYGRAFVGSMRAWFKMVDQYPRLSSGVLNAWLIAEITRL